MKKIILLSSIFVLVLLLAACQPSVDQAKADFCESLGEFAQAQVQFRTINATSTKSDLNEAVSDLDRAWENVKSSAADLSEAQLSGAEDALQTLKDDISDIPDDATLAESEAMIKTDVIATMAETQEIFSTTCTYGQDQ